MDKQLHFAVGAILFGMLFRWLNYDALFAVAVVAIAKEAYDFYHPKQHTADIFDAMASSRRMEQIRQTVRARKVAEYLILAVLIQKY